jgi:hypothetical protein
MRAIWPVGALLLAMGGGLYAVLNRQGAPSDVEIARLSSTRSLVWKEPQSSAGLCPWRAPEEDMRRWFPGAAASRDDTLILSRHRVDLQRRLGRYPTADDNALIVHRIVGTAGSPGFVVTRRVRGECGLIELAIATDPRGRVLGARIQRHREPDVTARVLQSEEWLAGFREKDSHSAWRIGKDVAPVPAEARMSADAVVNEARTVLILLDVALHSDTSLPPDAGNAVHEGTSAAR